MRVAVLLLVGASAFVLGCSQESQSIDKRSPKTETNPSPDVVGNQSESCINEAGVENFVRDQKDFSLDDEETDCDEVANSAAFGLVSGMTKPDTFRSSDPSCQSFSLGGGVIKTIGKICRRIFGYTDDVPLPPKPLIVKPPVSLADDVMDPKLVKCLESFGEGNAIQCLSADEMKLLQAWIDKQ